MFLQISLYKFFVWTHVFISLVICLGVEFLGHLVTIFKLLRNFQSFPKQLCNFTLSSATYKRSHLSAFSPALDIVVFLTLDILAGVVLSHCGFDLHFSDGSCKEYCIVKRTLYCKDKLRYVKILKAYLRKHRFGLGRANQMLLDTLHQQKLRESLYRADVEAKPGNNLIGSSLNSCLIWLFVIGHSLNFVFSETSAFIGIGSGLGFGLLTQATKALKPLLSNDLIV